MSALAALFHRDGAPLPPGAVAQMLESQARRGPDARRMWSSEGVALGHGLLATTADDDLVRQPFCSADGGLVVTLDGRLDNREELAEGASASRDPALVDVALVGAAYARWGESFAERLLGDFAIVLWDRRRRALVCARDPLGARPLYFRASPRAFRCASTPRALFAGSLDAPTPSFEAMSLFLAELHVEQRGTLLEGVSAVAPGAALIVTATHLRHVASSWPQLGRRVIHRTPNDYAAHFRDTLRDAVRARMRTRDPAAPPLPHDHLTSPLAARSPNGSGSSSLAAHVSGGLDSSSIAALASELASAAGAAPPLLVRCVFPGLACDESPFSQAVADHLGRPLASAVLPGDLAAYRPDPASVAPDTFYGPVPHMLLAMAHLGLARGARVTLTGAGSDQFLQPTGLELADALLRGDLRAVAALSGLDAAPLAFAPYRHLLHDLRRALPPRLRRAVRALLPRPDGLPTWLSERARRAVRAATAAPSAALPHENLSINRLVMLLAHSADYTYALGLADQLAASAGTELRHPFFDRRVIELLLAFPNEARAESPPNKALLRRAMGSALPRAVLERSNAAEFSPFVKRTLVDAHGDHLADLLRDGRLAHAGLIDPRAATALVAQARADAPVLRELVSLAALEVWLRQLQP